MAGHHVSDIGERPPHIALLGDERASLLLRPLRLRGLPLMVFAPRVPLRSTRGYDPAPLRGSKTSSFERGPLRVCVAAVRRRVRQRKHPVRASQTSFDQY